MLENFDDDGEEDKTKERIIEFLPQQNSKDNISRDIYSGSKEHKVTFP